MLIDAMIRFRRAKSPETLDIMFNGACRNMDLDPVSIAPAQICFSNGRLSAVNSLRGRTRSAPSDFKIGRAHV